MARQIKEALAAQREVIAHIRTSADEGALDCAKAVYAVLEAAQQEAEAWETIGAWCEHKFRMCRYDRSGWHHFTLGAPGEIGGTVFQGPDRLRALTEAAAWCRAELGK